jgi:hypothetical protein
MNKELVIYTEELPQGWLWTPEMYVGGTPEFVVNTAECAAKIFEDVTVYYDGAPYIDHNGVTYAPRKLYRPSDVVLCCNSTPNSLGGHNIYWSNWYHNRSERYLAFDEIIALSPFHQGIFGEGTRIVPHACWPDQFKNPDKISKRCLYSSSPDRGGDFLKGIWPEVKERTGAELITTYENALSEDTMIDLYRTSQFWLHPGQGIELYCIAALKAQAAKCIPVVVPNMALETTVQYGIKTDIDKYKNVLIESILNPPEVEDIEIRDWMSVTEELFMNADI